MDRKLLNVIIYNIVHLYKDMKLSLWRHICLLNAISLFQVLEYAVSLNSEDHYIPVLQVCDNFNSGVVWRE